MNKPLRVLLVEDSEDDAQLVLRALKRADYDLTWLRVETAEAMQQALAERTWDVVLSDHAMPHFSAPAALELLKATGQDVPFLIVSGKIGEEKAVELMRGGARDYILKDNLGRLVPAIERELREAHSRREHKSLEEQFRQAQKMESLGQLAGGVAHDFNNLITVINGFSELVLARLEANDPARPFLEQIKRAGERSAALARQLLIFSRKQVVMPRLLDLNAVISEAEKMLRRIIGEDIKLVTEPAPRLRQVMADPGQIEQILFNLATNARDAMPRGGQIAIRTRNMTFAEGYARPVADLPLGSYVVLEFSDSGMGMTPEVLSHIFEPFFTTKEVGKGTGLGLSTAFGIVKQSGGSIAVESQPGAGTTFRIYLPEASAAPSERADQPSPTVEAPSRGNEVLLVAEDDDSVRGLVTRILVRNGYTVLEACNGPDALELARQYSARIDGLVTDIVMPVMNGVELAQQLRRVHPETCVLFVSGYPGHAGNSVALPREAEFLAKPLSAAALTCQVRKMLDKARPGVSTPCAAAEMQAQR